AGSSAATETGRPGSDRARLRTGRDRDAHRVAPLGPRAVVVADVPVAEQVRQREPGVAGALADAAVRDHRVVGAHAEALGVDRLELGTGLVGAVLGHRRRPRDVARRGDVAAAQHALLGVVRDGDALARVLLRRADVDERTRAEVRQHVLAEGADRGVVALD